MPTSVLDALRARFTWLDVRRVEPGLTYGDQKAVATRLSHTDILVYADSDCVYEPGWLAALLETFREEPEAGAVAGETTIAIRGPFTLATALFYFFPRFSAEDRAAPARGFYFNNVAFRRGAVRAHPVPFGLPLRRGQNVIYSRILAAGGVPMLRQPRARALHAPPEGLGMALWVLFSVGRDTARLDEIEAPIDPFSGDYEPYGPPTGRMGKIIGRLRGIVKEEPRVLGWLPLALPVVALAFGAFALGRVSPPARTAPLR